MTRITIAIILLAAFAVFPAAATAQQKGKADWNYPPQDVAAAGEGIPMMTGGEVKLPWQEFAKVLEQLMEKSAAQKSKPPVGYTVDSAAYTCEAGEKEAVLKAKMKIWVFDKGYTIVPLLRGGIAVESAKFTGAKAAMTQSGGWIAAVAQGPATFTIDMTGRAPVETDHGMKFIRLEVPQAGSSTLDCSISMKNASVKLQPGVITRKSDTDKGVKIGGSLFSEGYLDLRWWEEVKMPEEEKKKEEPRVYAEVNTLLSIGEGLIIAAASIDYSIVQGEVEELRILVPEDIVVNNVQGVELKDWTLEKTDAGKMLSAFLSYKVSGSYTLNISYEKAMGKTSAVVKVPELKVLGVERETGSFGVAARTNVEISAGDISGSTQIDPKEAFHPVIASSSHPVLLAFKYLKHPFDIVLDVKKHFDVPVLVAAVDLADIQSVLTVEGKYLTRAIYLVRNNMKQFLKARLPGKSQVWSTYVAGKPVKPGKDDEGRILVPLENSKAGPGEMASFAVEIVYLTKVSGLAKRGKADLTLLEVDLPISKLQWTLYLPSSHKYKKFDGNVEEAELPFEILPEEKLRAMPGPDFYAQSQSMLQQNVMNVPDIQAKLNMQGEGMIMGVMPVKMEIPQQGKVFRFTKMLVIDEKPALTFKYRKKWFK